MARDSSGNYTSPSAQFSTGTTISSSVMNGKLNDIGTELTDSLSRNGKGGMVAALRGSNGTSAAPAFSFTAETGLGFYRVGAGQLGAASSGTDIISMSTTEVRVYSAAAFEDAVEVASGLTVLAPNNTAAITATGTGTGAGVTSTGGATGNGGTFTGGVSGALGVRGVGTVNNAGGSFQGQGTGAGLLSTGGATGVGATLQGGATSGAGANITGGPSSTGANITGGSGNAAGAVIAGTGTGVGAQIAAGTAATGADPTNALELTNGNLKLSGTAPNSDEALANTLTPANLCKAHGMVTITGGALAITAGFNLTSVAKTVFGGSYDVLRVTFAQAFSNANYTVVPTAQSNATPVFYTASVVNKATTHVDIMLIQLNTSPPAYTDIDAGATNAVIEFVCFGLN